MQVIKGPTRRDFLHLGAIACPGLNLPALLRAQQGSRANAGTFGKARRCILLFLTGGPPQLDTWDLKPLAPERIRGELRPIATRVTGLRISELFPRVAKRTRHLCVVRSVTHEDRTHTSAGYTMLTGVAHPLANASSAMSIQPGPNDHPHIGSLLAQVRPSRRDLPTFVALPEIIKDANVNLFPGQDGGILGKSRAPLLIEGNLARTDFILPDLFLPADINAARLAQRQTLRDRFERQLAQVESRVAGEMDVWYQKAFDVLRSAQLRGALDLTREPAANRERYGSHLFGQGCLLARRLVEAGVGLASVYWHYEGPDDSPVWDTHWNNFAHLRRRLMPATDQALAALVDDLAQRGLLEDTLVVCMGEFGRTPLINRYAGRDHWAQAQSIVLAGAGVQAGTVYGATDRDGARPIERAVRPQDLTATMMHLLGIQTDLQIHDRQGRPLPACTGKPITGILG